MAEPNVLTGLVMASCQLKAAAPEAFKHFCDTLKTYESQAIVEAINADPPEVFRGQGKVKTVQQLRKHISECYELRETFNRRENNARNP